MPEASKSERMRYIDERINTDWGYEDYVKERADALSLADILRQLQRAFGRENVPKSTMPILRDIRDLRAAFEAIDEDDVSEAKQLLDPERFPEWRAKFFRVPETGESFQTPKFQHAIFWVMHAATFKIAIPDWVIELLDELDPVHPFPEDINELIAGETKTLLSFILLMAPRHGKTELAVHFMLHTYAMDQNKRILFGNGTQQKTEGFIDNAIMAMMVGEDTLSKDYVDMYGPFRHDKRAWSRKGFVLAGREFATKAMSMQPFGISGSIRSFDADVILADDLQSLQRAESETTTEGDYRWYTTELMLRREYGTALINLGSHVAVDTGDLFARLESSLERMNVGRQRVILKKIPAHDYTKCSPDDPEHTQCILWKDFDERDYGFLEAQRANLNDDAMFEAVYNQVPQQRKMMHFPKINMRTAYKLVEYDTTKGITPAPILKDEAALGVLDESRSWYKVPDCCGLPTLVALGFDPAASERKGSSFSALSVRSGCPKCGRRYAVDWWKDRQSPEMHPETIGTYTNAYPEIAVVNIEINAYQRSLSRDPRMQKLEAEGTFVIKEWNTDERKHDPRQGIPVLGRAVKSGLYSIPYRTLADEEHAESVIKELIRWPQKPNDFVMADWLAELALAEMIEDSQHVMAELIPGAERWMSAWHDTQMYEVDLSDIQSA